MIPPVKPGDNIRDALTARTFNQLIKKQENYSRGEVPNKYNPVCVNGVSNVGVDAFVPVGLGGPTIPNGDVGELDYNVYYNYPVCNITDTYTDENWIVPQGPSDGYTTIKCVVLGLTWVYADITDITHTRLYVSSGSLVSDESRGKALIVSSVTTTGEQYVLVLLGVAGIPTEIQTVLTQIRVSANKVQYKERDIVAFFDTVESDWIDLPSEACT